jgi:ribosomal-protein-alanine N-acetyltransferase
MPLVLERCTVRPWRLDDARPVAGHANNRKIWLAVRDLLPHPYTIQDAHEFLQRTVSEQPAIKFCIEIDGTAVGGIGVHPGRDVYRHTATVGYWLGEQFWGRGIMTEVVTSVTDFCFDNFPLRRISAEVLCQQSRIRTRAGKSRFHFRRAPQEQRDEGWTSSRFTALRPDKVVPFKPATCVSVDHRRYGSPQ